MIEQYGWRGAGGQTERTIGAGGVGTGWTGAPGRPEPHGSNRRPGPGGAPAHAGKDGLLLESGVLPEHETQSSALMNDFRFRLDDSQQVQDRLGLPFFPKGPVSE